MSVSHENLLLLKNATVNWNLAFDNVCKEKHVMVAYNNDPPTFEVSNITGEMVEYPVAPYVTYWSMAWEYEIQAAFFENNNIQPKWLNCNHTWGTLNYTTGQWSGAVGMLQRDEADYALPDSSLTYHKSKVAAFSPPIRFKPLYWIVREPVYWYYGER